MLRPDAATIEESYAYAESRFGSEWEYLLAPDFLPHITLYHSKMRDVPEEFALTLRDELSEGLRGLEIRLQDLVCFGDKFAFWNVIQEGESYEQLVHSHEKALTLARYLDPTAAKRADEEGLSLTPEQRENVERYNHPLVRGLYTPHITLAYDTRAAQEIRAGEKRDWTMTADCVEFAEIGHPGVVLSVVR